MTVWLSANLGTVVVGLVLLAIVVLVIRRMLRDRKAGKSPCGCSCAECSCGCGTAKKESL